MTADAPDPFEEPRGPTEEDAFFADAGEERIPAPAEDAIPSDDGPDADGAPAEVLEETADLPAEADLLDTFEEYDDAGEEEDEGPREPSPYDRPGEWFVVHTYAGYENKVKSNLASRVRSMNMEERIFEVVIPMEDVMEIKGGKKQVVSRKVFPGYLLVRMYLDDDSWYVVRNTPGVTGFVGAQQKPVPLNQPEVDRLLSRETAERPRTRAQFSIGESVKVVSGPLSDFSGEISEINEDAAKLKVLVSIFGRETPVEVGFNRVKKI